MRVLSVGGVLALGGCTALNPAYGTAGGTGGASGGASTTQGEAASTGAASDSKGSGTVAGTSATEGDPPSESSGSGGDPVNLCGNGLLNSGEDCDDGNLEPGDGCTGQCFIPRSCLEIIGAHPDAADGEYLIDPAGDGLLEAYCDMTSDGGGYTFYRVELQDLAHTPMAEQICADLGMQLWIPRSPDHRQAGCELGEPDIFMRIMGVYPRVMGSACNFAELNSDSPECDWVAGDGRPFWVHGDDWRNEPNGSALPHQSAHYEWVDCDIDYMDDQGGMDRSIGFYCDVGDKWGAR